MKELDAWWEMAVQDARHQFAVEKNADPMRDVSITNAKNLDLFKLG